jgi:hypothetical protein
MSIENCNNCYVKRICFRRQEMIPLDLKIKKMKVDTQIKTVLEDKKCNSFRKA